MEMTDRNGMTEEEFLKSYNPDKYPKPALTADMIVLRKMPDGSLRILLIRRGGHPFLGRWALPGGFANKNEATEQTAVRELEEETGLRGLEISLVGFYSKPGRDPRGWTVSAAYAAVIPEERAGEVRAGDDAAQAAWFTVSADAKTGKLQLTCTGVAEAAADPGSEGVDPETLVPDDRGCLLAFDHDEIVGDALRAVCAKKI
ncbi:MAG: NUDIX hydrolase [Eubacterium sp.]|nr:NUDIX hydrolase [Eubacterium sp.]MBQ6362536.1 NUDIX hydrolase [Lachnospiraceae bacterium]